MNEYKHLKDLNFVHRLKETCEALRDNFASPAAENLKEVRAQLSVERERLEALRSLNAPSAGAVERRSTGAEAQPGPVAPGEDTNGSTGRVRRRR